jgi:8-oxo-dGTP pyrophosphatase MutT (NUDIX family)
LAIFDASGHRIGVKLRGEVHRDGDWHWLVFVWVARLEDSGGRRFLLQLRARPEDPYRGQLDAPAGGHVSASENHLESALRECHEEMGVVFSASDLIYLGERSLESPTGVCRRVIEHFYLCVRPLRLEETAFTAEADGFVEVDLDEFEELISGTRIAIDGRARLRATGDAIQSIRVGREYVAAYSEEILGSFRYSLSAVRRYLDTAGPKRGQ